MSNAARVFQTVEVDRALAACLLTAKKPVAKACAENYLPRLARTTGVASSAGRL